MVPCDLSIAAEYRFAERLRCFLIHGSHGPRLDYGCSPRWSKEEPKPAGSPCEIKAMLLTCSLRTCSSCAAKDSCRFAVSAAAPGGNPVWSFSMVSEPFSEEFGSLPPLREGHVGTRRPTWLVYWLLARPFFIRDRWRLKEVDHPPPVKVKEKLFFFSQKALC